MSIQITVNDDDREVPSGCSIGGLLDSLGISRRLVAVEQNGTLVPAAEFDCTPVQEGDRLEVVTLVGGG